MCVMYIAYARTRREIESRSVVCARLADASPGNRLAARRCAIGWFDFSGERLDFERGIYARV